MLGARRGRNRGALAESTSDEVTEGSDTQITIFRQDQDTSAESRSVSGIECSTGDGRPNVGNIDQDSARNAAVCEMWCAIAIGALVQGAPPERVSRASEGGLFVSRRFTGCEEHKKLFIFKEGKQM